LVSIYIWIIAHMFCFCKGCLKTLIFLKKQEHNKLRKNLTGEDNVVYL
jgi:hypothetical protein